MKNNIVFGILLLFFVSNVKSEKIQKEDIIEVSAVQLHKMLGNKVFTLVNVHVPYAGEIPQTDLFIPYDKIRDHLNELPAKDHKIVLYCRSDHMSTIAAEGLAEEGYSELYNLKGGMSAWKESGYHLMDNQSTATDKNPQVSNIFASLRDAGKVISLSGGEWETGPVMTYVSVSPDGKLLLATSSKENEEYLVDLV